MPDLPTLLVNFRNALNKCTRTVAWLMPVAALISAGVRSSRWQSVNTSRCRSGRAATASVTCCPPFLRQQPPLVRRLVGRHLLDGPAVVLVRRVADPALLPAARLQPIERGVDQNAREPDIERQLAAILLDVQEHLHERVLHGLVGVGRIAQILERDPERPPLQQRHQRAEAFARRVTLAGFDERLDLGGQHRGRRRMRGVGRAGLPLGGEVDVGLSCHCLREWPCRPFTLVTTSVAGSGQVRVGILT